jgi:tetratricopeptide (TPR) repeat protein
MRLLARCFASKTGQPMAKNRRAIVEQQRVTSYSRQDVLRILQISPRQLQAWEKAELIPRQQSYSFQDLGQLRTLRLLREEDVPAASVRRSIVAMKAVAGMENPLLEAKLVRTGSRLAFRHHGAILDPIKRQLLFDFDRLDAYGQVDRSSAAVLARFEPAGTEGRLQVQDLFLEAVRAEEEGQKQKAITLYEGLIACHPDFAPPYINLGTIHFHMQEYVRAEELYRQATVMDPGYVLAFFDLGNVLDELNRSEESIAAYRRAVELAPEYADAHYNLALAFERRGEWRDALRHWQSYLRIDKQGPWADHARGQIKMLLSQEKLTIAARSKSFAPPRMGRAQLDLVEDAVFAEDEE